MDERRRAIADARQMNGPRHIGAGGIRTRFHGDARVVLARQQDHPRHRFDSPMNRLASGRRSSFRGGRHIRARSSKWRAATWWPTKRSSAGPRFERRPSGHAPTEPARRAVCERPSSRLPASEVLLPPARQPQPPTNQHFSTGRARPAGSSRHPARRPSRAARSARTHHGPAPHRGRQRLGQREEPPAGVLRAAEAHLDPAGLDRHALGGDRRAAESGGAGRRKRGPWRGRCGLVTVQRAWLAG